MLTGPKSPPIATADDLSGKKVHVRPSSSAYESLKDLNARFQASGKAPVTLVTVPDALESEDMMEMLNLTRSSEYKRFQDTIALFEATLADPNVWFNDVEVVTAERIGLETTTYVRNSFK